VNVFCRLIGANSQAHVHSCHQYGGRPRHAAGIFAHIRLKYVFPITFAQVCDIQTWGNAKHESKRVAGGVVVCDIQGEEEEWEEEEEEEEWEEADDDEDELLLEVTIL
jgi:hypothetical protein